MQFRNLTHGVYPNLMQPRACTYPLALCNWGTWTSEKECMADFIVGALD